MKKIFKIISMIIASGLLSICLWGCQETPSDAIVKNKQIDYPESVSVSPDSNELKQIEVPEIYEDTFSDDYLTLNFVADIDYSEENRIMLLRAMTHQFSQETVDKVAAELMGDTTYQYIPGEQTKEELEQELIATKALLEKAKNGDDVFDVPISEVENTIQEIENRIATNQYLEIPIKQNSLQYSIDEELHLYKIEGGNKLILNVYDDKDGLPEWIVYSRDFKNYEFSELLENDYEIEEIRSSRDEIEKYASTIVKNMGFEDMKITVVGKGYMSSGVDDIEKDSVAYIIAFTRIINNIPVTFDSRRLFSGIDPNDGEQVETFNKLFAREWILLTVDNGGVQNVTISGNMNYIENISEVQLCNFDKIMDITKNAIIRQNIKMNYDIAQVTINIKHIKFGYVQTISRDNPNELLLVPAWDFFGNMIYTDEYGEKSTKSEIGESLLTINAIDGSIINRDIGY